MTPEVLWARRRHNRSSPICHSRSVDRRHWELLGLWELKIDRRARRWLRWPRIAEGPGDERRLVLRGHSALEGACFILALLHGRAIICDAHRMAGVAANQSLHCVRVIAQGLQADQALVVVVRLSLLRLLSLFRLLSLLRLPSLLRRCCAADDLLLVRMRLLLLRRCCDDGLLLPCGVGKAAASAAKPIINSQVV